LKNEQQTEPQLAPCGHFWCNEHACYERPHNPELYEPILKEPKPGEVEAEIQKIMLQWPHLTRRLAGELMCLRASANVAAVVQGSDGGGRYGKFCKVHGVKW
jgi:hypothetical protein